MVSIKNAALSAWGDIGGIVATTNVQPVVVLGMRPVPSIVCQPGAMTFEFLIKVILDNHFAHISKEMGAYLATVPNRFEFIFTPKHGSWLNLIESFFSNMSRQMLRGIRVTGKTELKAHILEYLQEINLMPVVFRWKYKLDTVRLA